jgi:hypothetical protein
MILVIYFIFFNEMIFFVINKVFDLKKKSLLIVNK